MSRRLSRSKKTKPRSQRVIDEINCLTQRVYLEDGGHNIDFTIEAARSAVEMCRQRVERGPTENGQDPLKLMLTALRELRLAEAMREKKLTQYRAMMSEAKEAELEAAEQESKDPPQPKEREPQNPVPEYEREESELVIESPEDLEIQSIT